MERLIRLLDDLDDVLLRVTWRWSAGARRRAVAKRPAATPAVCAGTYAEHVPAA